MQWRTDEITLEEMILSQKSKAGDMESVGRLLVKRAWGPLTYEQVLKWPASMVKESIEAMIAAMPKYDGLDNYRRQLGGS